MIERKGPGIEHQVDFILLKEMRNFLQWRSGDAIMLAEANVPPDESLEYFGSEGDRLQINFPVNQRLFDALATADIDPLIAALEDMRRRPRAAQWVQFLRSHDELDLGRLTEEEVRRCSTRSVPSGTMRSIVPSSTLPILCVSAPTPRTEPSHFATRLRIGTSTAGEVAKTFLEIRLPLFPRLFARMAIRRMLKVAENLLREGETEIDGLDVCVLLSQGAKFMSGTSRAKAAFIICATAGLWAVHAPPATGAPIELETALTGPSMQLDGGPCIIGDPSCQNPDSFPFTLIAPRQDEGTLSSPTYTVDQLRSAVGGDTFSVGVDLNQAMGHSGGAYTLESLAFTVDGVTRYATSGPVILVPRHAGHDGSDASLGTFDLTGLSGDAKGVFTAEFSGATGGREQFFLAPAAVSPPAPVPEPATMFLVGSGLAGMAVARRRRRNKPEA